MTLTREQTLDNVIAIMRSGGLTPADVRGAWPKDAAPANPAHKMIKGEVILRLFSWLGGALIFAGLGVFMNTIWDDIGSLPRVVITLGAGVVAYLLALVFENDPRFEKTAVPAYLVAFFLQPTGLFVFLHEYFDGGNPALGALLVFGALTVQMGFTFAARRRPHVFFFTLFYGLGAIAAATDYFDFDRGFVSLVTGLALFFISVDAQKRPDLKDITWVLYIVSTALFFAGLYYYIGRTIFDPLALSITLGLLAYAVRSGTKTLYVLSALYLFCYFCGGPGGGWAVWNDYNHISAIFTGLSLMLAGQWMAGRADHISVYPLWMFTGTGFALGGAYELLRDTALEPVFIGVAALGIYAALALRSRAVLAISLIALVGFITDFSAKHFAGTIGWPLLLILIGFIILGCGFLFAKASRNMRVN